MNQPRASDSRPADREKRATLASLAASLGLALSAPALDALAAGYTPQADTPNRRGKVFDQVQFVTARALVARIIPTTDTPGAHQVDAHGYMDHHLAVCADEHQPSLAQRGLNALQQQAEARHQTAFALLDSPQQDAIITDMASGGEGFTLDHQQAFGLLKQLTVFAYYTSEVGATTELTYLAVPGGYTGELAFDEIGRAWSLMPF